MEAGLRKLKLLETKRVLNRRRSFIDVLLPSDVAAASGSRGRALLEALRF